MQKKKTARPEMCWLESRQQWRKRITIDGKQHNVFGKTQEEVREKIKDLERQHDAGMVLGDETTLALFAKEWFPIKTAGLKPASVGMYKNTINVHIMPFFKNIKLSEIRPLHVQKLMAARPELSKSMQTKILITLSQIMKSAIDNGLISKNPCDGIKPGGYAPREKKPLTKEQQLELTKSIAGKRCELFVLLCLYAGLRREEALGILWENVHLDTDTPYIDVRHTVTFDGNRPIHSESLKTKAARRSIPIPPVLSSALKTAKKSAYSLTAIAPVKSGSVMSATAFQRMWGIAVKSVDFHIEPHVLRHTYLTELCASGMDIKKIQYLAGHEDVTMTLKVYAHVTQNRPQELSAMIKEIFSGTGWGTYGVAESKID